MSTTLRRRGGASTLSATIQEADSESDLTILEGDEKQPAVEIHAEKGERDMFDSSEAFAVGLKAQSEGLHAHHPMIMIPGVISTGLESWGTANISRSYFRKRLWAAYDWRLSYPNLEVRDRYFTKLKSYLEISLETSGTKAVLVSHSMGSQVLFYFFHWVASESGGQGGDDWVERHVDSWINISGCMLGAVKGVTAILSGEMRDTAQLNAFAVYGLEKFLSREERAELFRAMPGISSMLPMGGNAVWGDASGAPDDQHGQKLSYGSFLNFRVEPNATTPSRNMTVNEAMDYLSETTDPWYRDMIKRSYSNGIAHNKAEVDANEKDPRKWVNPLETRLPLAPNLKIYCFYGVGKPTERGYYYRGPEKPGHSRLNITIDTALTAEGVDHGVIMGEGDGTVNLLSTGYMCNRGWRMKRYNPAGAKITVVEMPHEPERFNPRGGPKTADHVDILGRQTLNELIIKVAAGQGHTIEDYVVSNILEYADKVQVGDAE
ncbi:unnamed protein product [Parascedosporium putredinis]|uniref:Phospholipid:diacylglycerol acyltransferase n=1 Tax=Parascedosporium putredinis TaxID=1442378 RepID=A0A9P1H2W4_9PEZI|nr:unnamed protein product [Parascedosporium putredinis]CAI7994628.1 unnamed protein product [Parascedosporium putredinis]